MDQAVIRIAYDGEALRSGTMDVRDLAPALMALSDLFEESHKVLHGKDATIQLRVRSDFQAGSFHVTLELVQGLTKLLALFSGQEGTGLANLVTFLGFCGASTSGVAYGLIKLIKWLRGRRVSRFEFIGEDRVRLKVEGDEAIIERSVFSIFNDVAVRRAVSRVLAPLRREGVDSFEVHDSDGSTIERVERSIVHYFDPPAPQPGPPQIIENEFEQAYTIVSVTFREGNKWRVYDGNNTINVTMEDENFLTQMDAHEVTFAKDDTIRCRVRQTQSIGTDGLKTESTIVSVLDHKRAPRQKVLFPAPEDEPDTPATDDSQKSKDS